jgi:hypothetical protein
MGAWQVVEEVGKRVIVREDDFGLWEVRDRFLGFDSTFVMFLGQSVEDPLEHARGICARLDAEGK